MNKLRLASLTMTFIVATTLPPAEASPPDIASARADDRSTVKLFFVSIPFARPTKDISNEEIAHVDNLVVPASEISPVSVYIDHDFVGHAMSNFVKVTPSFRLPPGMHEFQIECNGCQPFKSKLKVLGHGSEQWLVVTLRADPNRSSSPNTTPNERH